MKVFQYYHSVAPSPKDYDPTVLVSGNRPHMERHRYEYAMSKIAACKRLYKCTEEAYFTKPEGFKLGIIILARSYGRWIDRGAYWMHRPSSTLVPSDFWYQNVAKLHISIEFVDSAHGEGDFNGINWVLLQKIEKDLLRCGKVVEVEVEYIPGAEMVRGPKEKPLFLAKVESKIRPKLEEKLGRTVKFRLS